MQACRGSLTDAGVRYGVQNRRMSAFRVACDGIESAEAEREVLVAVQRFLAALPQSERDQLPWGMLARPLANVGDIALWTLQLVTDHLDVEDTSPGRTYGQTVEVFKRAAARLVELRRADGRAAQAK